MRYRVNVRDITWDRPPTDEEEEALPVASFALEVEAEDDSGIYDHAVLALESRYPGRVTHLAVGHWNPC
jgi:hypothetical protein